MKNSKITVELSVFGDTMTPSQLSTLLGISPTHSWEKGDIIVRNDYTLKRKESAWVYRIENQKSLLLDSLTKKLVVKFRKKSTKLVDFIVESNSKCKIFILAEIFEGEKPVFYFNKDFLSFVNKIEAEIDIDYYCF